MPLPNTPSFCINIGPFPGYNVTDQSCLIYDPVGQQALIFGGGHAAAWEDAPLRMPRDTLKWEWCYAPTPLATMQQVGPDGKYVNLQSPEKMWKRAELGLPPPARSPVSRHSYTFWIWSHAINRALLLGGNNANPYELSSEVNGGYGAEFDPGTNEWTVLPWGDWRWVHAEDPLSGRILALWNNGLRTYDPVNRVWSAPKLPAGVTKLSWVSYGLNMTYYPPTDSFFFFRYGELDTPNGPAVYEIVVDRTTWVPKVSGPLSCNWHPKPRWQGTGMVYDSKARLIVGHMMNGKMYGFRPIAPGEGEWLEHPIPTMAQPAAYTHTYVEEIDTHFIITGNGVGDQTWAFRWDVNQAVRAVDPRKPKATINIGTQTFATMQEACSVGGDITLGTGALYGLAAAAQIDKPVTVTGAQTELIDGIMGGKGTFIVNANALFANVSVTGAKVPDMNGAAFRWQGGDLTLLRSTLVGNQNGLLGGNGNLILDDCDVLDNGAADGQSHGLYVQGTALSAVVRYSRFNGTKIGHHVKSRAAVTTVDNCLLGLDFLGTESCNVDLPDGGVAVIRNSYLRKGAKADNNTFIKYFAELRATHATNSLHVHDTTLESKIANAIGLRNTHPTVVALLERVAFVGTFATLAMGWHSLRSCTLNGQPIPDKDVLPPPTGDTEAPGAPTAFTFTATKEDTMYQVQLTATVGNEPRDQDVTAAEFYLDNVLVGTVPCKAGEQVSYTFSTDGNSEQAVGVCFIDDETPPNRGQMAMLVLDLKAPGAPVGFRIASVTYVP